MRILTKTDLKSVSKVSFCDHRPLKLTHYYIYFFDPWTGLFVLFSIARECHSCYTALFFKLFSFLCCLWKMLILSEFNICNRFIELVLHVQNGTCNYLAFYILSFPEICFDFNVNSLSTRISIWSFLYVSSTH